MLRLVFTFPRLDQDPRGPSERHDVSAQSRPHRLRELRGHLGVAPGHQTRGPPHFLPQCNRRGRG